MTHSHKINLKSIRKYNPGTLDDEDVINNYISRQKIFHKLIQEIQSETTDSIPQHYLIIGQRGMGKTTLLKRIEVELKVNASLHPQFVPLLYPEEQYNIDRLSKFWFNTLDQLLDYMDQYLGPGATVDIDQQIQQLLATHEEEVLAEKAYDLVRHAISKINKRPVLLVDNIDQLFSLLNDTELWNVRQKITEPGAPLFIGASSAPFEEVFTYDKAFYDHFKSKYLDPLEENEFAQLIQTLASNLENDHLKKKFRENETRIKSLYRLAGGNIRTAIILFTSLANGFGDTIADDLDELLDEMTPIYKARIEELSDQLKAIVDEIALEHKPIDLERLREKTRITNNTLSPQLRRLRQMGWISKEEKIKGRSSYYQITERFFNVWYLMRRSTRRNKRNISVLSAFLKEWIENKDKQGQQLLGQQILRPSDITTRLALSDHVVDASIRASLISQVQQGIEELAAKDPAVAKMFAEYRKQGGRVHLPDWLEEFQEIGEKGDPNEAAQYLLEVIDKDQKDFRAWYVLGNLYQNHLGDYEKSRESYERALSLDENYVYAWYKLGNLYQDHLRDYEKSRESYERALSLDENYVHAWNGLGNLYQDHLGDYEKSRESYERALSLDENYVYAWYNLGNLYQYHLGDYEKSRESYERALSLDENNVHAWNNLGRLYQYHLGDYEKSRKSYERALSLDENYVHAWNNLGNLFQDHLNDATQAIKYYNRALRLSPNDIAVLYNLTFLRRDITGDIEEAQLLFTKAKEVDTKVLNDTFHLHQSLFEVYKKNFGNAAEHLKEAIAKLGQKPPRLTMDDWIRYAAVAIHKDFGEHFLDTLELSGIHTVMRPYYDACVAMQKGDVEYLYRQAVEIRTTALEVYEYIDKYRSMLPK